MNPLTNHSSDVLNKLPENTMLGSGLKIRKVHKQNKYHIKRGGNIISSHKSRKLAEDKMKRMMKVC